MRLFAHRRQVLDKAGNYLLTLHVVSSQAAQDLDCISLCPIVIAVCNALQEGNGIPSEVVEDLEDGELPCCHPGTKPVEVRSELGRRGMFCMEQRRKILDCRRPEFVGYDNCAAAELILIGTCRSYPVDALIGLVAAQADPRWLRFELWSLKSFPVGHQSTQEPSRTGKKRHARTLMHAARQMLVAPCKER